jgi:hypothetical protein
MLDAAGIIGSGGPGDYGPSPVEHAEQLKTSAPKLAALLARSAPIELARQYADADTETSLTQRLPSRSASTVASLISLRFVAVSRVSRPWPASSRRWASAAARIGSPNSAR